MRLPAVLVRHITYFYISAHQLTVARADDEPVVFSFPPGVFGDAEAMAEAAAGLTDARRRSVRICLNTRRMVIRPLIADCPFDETTHVLRENRALGLSAALPLTIADALVHMCMRLGIDLYRIRAICPAEQTVLAAYGREPYALLLPQEDSVRVLLSENGALADVYTISDHPGYGGVELDRVWLSRPLPELALCFTDTPRPWLRAYFAARATAYAEEPVPGTRRT